MIFVFRTVIIRVTNIYNVFIQPLWRDNIYCENKKSMYLHQFSIVHWFRSTELGLCELVKRLENV